MIRIFLSYIIALLISAGGMVGGVLYIRKVLKKKVRWSFFFTGVIAAVLLIIGIIVLFQATFSTENYYNTPFFRTIVGLVFLALLSTIRFFLVKTIFYNGYREEQGHSFDLGFGLAPLSFLGAYLLIMILVLTENCIFNGPCMIEESYLSFADNTIISIFQPVSGHISFAVLFVFYAVMVLSVDRYTEKITFESYHPAVSVGWCILLILLEAVSVLPIPFIKMFELKHWQLPLIAGIVGLLSVLLVFFMPKQKKTPTYTKQFE